jgi:hypothetical protein
MYVCLCLMYVCVCVCAAQKVKLYSEFYDSDIILASPLGLRLVTGAVGDKARDIDFLSSIEGMPRAPVRSQARVVGELFGACVASMGACVCQHFVLRCAVCIVEQCDALLMQNWEHTKEIMAALNSLPSKVWPRRAPPPPQTHTHSCTHLNFLHRAVHHHHLVAVLPLFPCCRRRVYFLLCHCSPSSPVTRTSPAFAPETLTSLQLPSVR